MADTKISQLPLFTGTLAGNVLIPFTDDPGGTPTTKRAQLSTMLSSSLMSNTPTGTITATTNQTALNQLDTNKANKVSSPTTNNLAGLTSSGDLQDSGFNSLSFHRVASYLYDFSALGGATGDITLTAETGVIPNNAVITSGWIDVITNAASGGSATIALRVQSSNDILAATGYGSFTAGRLAVVPTAATIATTSIKTTATRNVIATIATAALTAGRFRVVLSYVVSS